MKQDAVRSIRPHASPLSSRTSPSIRSLAMMLLLVVLWGLSIPVTKLGLETVPPLTLTAMRFAVAVVPLFLFTLGRPGLPWKGMPRAAALGVLGIGVGQVAQAFGIEGTAASVGTIISATIPVFVVVFAALRLGQAVTGRQQIGLVTAFAGIALVALGHGQEAGAALSSTVGGAAWMLSAVAIAFYYVWSVELTRDHGTVPVAAWSTLFGFLALLPWAGWEAWHGSIHVTAQATGLAVYLGAMVSVAGLFLWLHILRTVPAPIAAGVQYLQPVVGIIAAAAVMFGDRLGLMFVAGVVLILGGLGLAVASRSQAEEAVPHEEAA